MKENSEAVHNYLAINQVRGAGPGRLSPPLKKGDFNALKNPP
jgi:hypothetical protein